MAAWIKAETGVGPSMASGNQICNPIWADFPITPPKNNKAIKFKKFNLIPLKIIILFLKKGIKEKKQGVQLYLFH